MKRFCLVVVGLLVIGSAYSQVLRLSGQVKDAEGLPLADVAVGEKGNGPSIKTDQDGNFELLTRRGAVINFSKAGFSTVEVDVTNEDRLHVSMRNDVSFSRVVQDVGYYSVHRDNNTGAVGFAHPGNFNQGNIYQPEMLLQGRIPGVSVTNRGGDPNVESYIRIRGLTSFDGGAQPLIVIDGVPMASLTGLDPQDVANVTILKDGASAAIFGIRGSQGVILINTKTGAPEKGIAVSMKVQGSFAAGTRQQPVLSAEEYIQAGGNDLGGDTNWQREVTRVGASQEYHLAVSGTNDNTSFRVATHFRSVGGILLNSGFDQANARLNLLHQAFAKRLRIQLNASMSKRNIDYSFPEAFKYATRFIPTAPIRFADGQFYQAILFENYNPVALLEQNVSEGTKRVTNVSGRVDWDVLKNLTATVQAAYQENDHYKGQFYSKKSFYQGFYANGLAEKFREEGSFMYATGYLTYGVRANGVVGNLTGGYAYQQDQADSYGATVRNFDNDESGYQTLSFSYDQLATQPGLVQLFKRGTPRNKTIGAFLRTQWQFDSVVNVASVLRYEGSSKLGANAKSGLFGSLSTNLDLLRWFKETNLSWFRFRVSYGVTGSVPVESGLAQDRFQYSVVTGNTVKIHSANPNLSWERKNEINAGVDLAWRGLSFSLDVFSRKMKDIILPVAIPPFGDIQYQNAADLAGRGVELTLGYQVGRTQGLQWNPTLMFNAGRVVVDRYPVAQDLRSSAEFCGCGTLLIRTAVGEKVGQMWSPVYDGVAPSGFPVMKDVNGDGTLVVNSGQALAVNTDFTDVGYGLPSWELGWNNRFAYKRFTVNVFFRGAFGHSLINSTRMSHEPENMGSINTFNWVRSSKVVAGLSNSVYSSLYVERADFLMLDNLTLEYTLPVKAGRRQNNIRFYGVAQRLFTITRYTGVDPEPALYDTAPWTTFNSQDVLAPGIDRMGSYSPARTFTIGVSFGL